MFFIIEPLLISYQEIILKQLSIEKRLFYVFWIISSDNRTITFTNVMENICKQ